MCYLHVLQYECEDKHAYNAPCEDREHIRFAFAFVCVVGKTLKTPKLSPMDEAITQGSIRSLVTPVYICDCNAAKDKEKK